MNHARRARQSAVPNVKSIDDFGTEIDSLAGLAGKHRLDCRHCLGYSDLPEIAGTKNQRGLPISTNGAQ